MKRSTASRCAYAILLALPPFAGLRLRARCPAGGADIERREQDYGSTPLLAAVVHRHERIIRTLVQRGADASLAMDLAQRGLAGDFEDDPRLDREGNRKIAELLRELGIGSHP